MLDGANAALTEVAHLGIDQLIQRRKGLAILGMSPTTGWRRERDDPDFPPKLEIGPHRYGYRLSDLQRYIATRPHAKARAKVAIL
jgi:predicted DNA-binding transcriptional regulator AlpA